MTHPVWLLIDPSGQAAGSSVRSARHALNDALWDIIADRPGVFAGMSAAIKATPTALRFECEGYVLAIVEVPTNA